MPQVPKVFHQAWCNFNDSLKSPTIPLEVRGETLKYMPPGFVYKCHDMRDMRSYLQEVWGDDFSALFDSYEKIPHKVDLWRYCILYEQGGIYMDADCVLKSDLTPLMQYDSVYVTNNRGVENVFNGFIVIGAHNPVMKDMVQFMKESGKDAQQDYYYNCKHLYTVLNRHVPFTPGQRIYESPETGRMCLLIDRKLSDGRYHVFYEAGDGEEVEVLVETNGLYPYMKPVKPWVSIAVSVAIVFLVAALGFISRMS